MRVFIVKERENLRYTSIIIFYDKIIRTLLNTGSSLIRK